MCYIVMNDDEDNNFDMYIEVCGACGCTFEEYSVLRLLYQLTGQTPLCISCDPRAEEGCDFVPKGWADDVSSSITNLNSNVDSDEG